LIPYIAKWCNFIVEKPSTRSRMGGTSLTSRVPIRRHHAVIRLSKQSFFAVALAALLAASAHANIAPSSKPVAGENQMFPNAPAPKTPPVAAPAPGQAPAATAGAVNAAVVAAASSVPLNAPSMPQPPLAWLFILSTLSLAGLALSLRLVLRT
jgi:hypothetical protein